MPEFPLEINGNMNPSVDIPVDGRNVSPMYEMENRGMGGMTMVSTGIAESSYPSNPEPNLPMIADHSSNLPKTKNNARKPATLNKRSGNEVSKRRRGTVARKNIELKAPFKDKPNDKNDSGFYGNSFDSQDSKSAYIQMISSKIDQLNQAVASRKRQAKPEITVYGIVCVFNV